MMRYKDISGKEIVDVKEGARLGVLGQTDLEIDVRTGQIKSFIIPNYKWFGLKKEGEETRIHWNDVKKIGEDMIMIETERSEEHTSELQSRGHLVCRLLLEKKKKIKAAKLQAESGHEIQQHRQRRQMQR